MHTLDTLKYFAHVLNEYANLLLAALTATYVWLTWRNLKALQRASLREPELRHLDDIKCNVARPLIDWLDSTAVKILGWQLSSGLCRQCSGPEADGSSR